MFTKTFVSLLALALHVSAQQPMWAQCGGIGWSGGTTCVSGAVCTKSNDYYSQCIPGTAPVTTPVTTVAPTTAIPTTSTNTASPGTTSPASTSCPAIGTITLKSNTRLPDPFALLAGGRVSTKAQWQCRREEISQLFQRYELGTLPGKPQSLTASFSGTTLTVNVSDQGKSISFTASITNMPSGTGPFPAIIAIGGSSIPAPSGVAIINFNNNDIAAQDNSGSRGKGKFYTLYGSGHSAGALMAWAWGVNRLIDALEITSGHKVDLKHLGVTGCSRNGKGAFVVGAFEPRIALTIPQESGSGGAGCWRISDAMLKSGINTQTASEIVGENVWFGTPFNQYVNNVPTLLHDHHMLAGLVAPRGLLVIENTGIDWLGPQSNWGCQVTGQKIYQALGVPDAMGVSQIGNHNHCAFPSTQQPELTAFVDKFLKGSSTNTNVKRTDGANNVGFVESTWVDWSVPTLT